MADPNAFLSTTREGLILDIFNRLSVQEGIAEADGFGNATKFKDGRSKVLGLLAEVVKAVDGKWTPNRSQPLTMPPPRV